MALFDFFKRDKGKELFEANADAETRADAIRREIQRLDLPGDINVKVEGSSVKVTGDVPDEVTRQKLAMIVGNVKYIDAVDDTGLSGVVPQTIQPKVYEVRRGDTLSEIAKQHYGDATAYPTIFEANQPMLKDPDDIYPGQILVIPEQPAAVS